MSSIKLSSPQARALVAYLEQAQDFPFARLETVSVNEQFDLIDIVVEPQLPQDRRVEILAKEPIRLRFLPDDSRAPSVFSRRTDFPHNQVHTNYTPNEDGLCLCIWEERWPELRRGLTAQALVERIRQWFAKTASGEIHQEGQALEPLLPPTAHTVILPPGNPTGSVWTVTSVDFHEHQWTAVLGAQSGNPGRDRVLQLEVLTIQLPVRVHGAVHEQPRTFEELQKLIGTLGVDRNAQNELLRGWFLAPERSKDADKRSMLILLALPQLKNAGDTEISWQYWAFLPDTKLSQLGEALGFSHFDAGTNTTAALIPTDQPTGLGRVVLSYCRVVQRLDRAAARKYAGTKSTKDLRLVAIGAGAIGSNVVIGTIRVGIGTWTIIDDDIQLPHNTVRQFQDDRTVGLDKARALDIDAEVILAEPSTTDPIRANVLAPGENTEKILERMNAADGVVDFSASPAVLGHIADQKEIRRAISFFFNPDGSDLVMLAEDSVRSLRLDEIEAQYFLATAQDAALKGHFAAARLGFIRYANACQDLSRPLPPWQVHTFAGIASGQLIRLSENSNAVGRVWRLNPQTGEIGLVTLKPKLVSRHAIRDWRITISASVFAEMNRLRAEALPNETGGILIGTFDLSRKIEHVLLALPAPPDSKQEPTYFIRGAKDLRAKVDALAANSAGTLGYLGEWHSHPDGADARPSRDDETVYKHLSNHIGPTGSPYLMAICGRDKTWFRVGAENKTQGELTVENADD